MHGLRARRVLRLRGPAALRGLHVCSENYLDAEPGSPVHRLQPPRMLEPRVQNLPDMSRSDMPRRRGMHRGLLAAEREAAAEVHGRKVAQFRRERCRYPRCRRCQKEMPRCRIQRFAESGKQTWTCGGRAGSVRQSKRTRKFSRNTSDGIDRHAVPGVHVSTCAPA